MFAVNFKAGHFTKHTIEKLLRKFHTQLNRTVTQIHTLDIRTLNKTAFTHTVRQCTHIANTVYVLNFFDYRTVYLFFQPMLTVKFFNPIWNFNINFFKRKFKQHRFNNIMYILCIKFFTIHRHNRYTVLCLKFSL